MKKIYLFVVLLLQFITINTIHGQSFSNSVISSGGHSSATDNLNINYTIGEAAPIATFQNGTLTLTQGFNQPLSGRLVSPITTYSSFKVYPIPTDDVVYIDYNTTSAGLLEITIYNVLSQPVFKKEIQTEVGMYKLPLDVSSLASGTYILGFNTPGNKSVRGTELVKIIIAK